MDLFHLPSAAALLSLRRVMAALLIYLVFAVLVTALAAVVVAGFVDLLWHGEER